MHVNEGRRAGIVMSFDPLHEDYQRMSLRFARTVNGADPYRAAREMLDFPRRFRSMRDGLPQTDQDRAFHLVVEATNIIDYQLPFVPESQILPMVEQASKLLDEALELDGDCIDAWRMAEIASRPSFSKLCSFLEDHADSVRTSCEKTAREASAGLAQDEARLALELGMRPYTRWMAMLSSKLLVCGKYRKSVEVGEALLKEFPRDMSDTRYTLALAYAKLEDEAGLNSLARRTAHFSHIRANNSDPWMLLARCALAHKARNKGEGRRLVGELTSNWHRGGATLTRQDELPDGVFSRIVVSPGSEDELILATSEAVVLLQEGREIEGRGSFGSWIAKLAGETRA